MGDDEWYVKLENGIMLQGGRCTGSGTQYITLPQPFYDANYFVFHAYENSKANDTDGVTFGTMGVYPKETTQFQTRVRSSSTTKVWLAVGRWKVTE